MKGKEINVNKLIAIKNKVILDKPLIHCITNHISINDCANVVLSVYGKPIMAEHCKEVSDITASSDGRETVVDMVRKVASKVFIPFTVGGGIRTVDDFKMLLRAKEDAEVFIDTLVTDETDNYSIIKTALKQVENLD